MRFPVCSFPRLCAVYGERKNQKTKKRLFVLVLCSLLFPAVAFAYSVPPNDGYVTDTAAVLSEDEEASLESTLREYRTQTSNEIAILIVSTLDGEPIADVAVAIGRKWGIGSKEYHNGILILIAYEERQSFIATGYGLEGAVPDIVAAGIVETDFAPSFREGKYAQGVQTGIESLMKHIGGEYAADRYASESRGSSGLGQFFFFLLFVGFDFLVALFGRTKSWWLGGVVGGLIGVVLAVSLVWWWSIPVLAGLGLLFDYLVSRNGGVRRHRRGIWYGGSGMGGGGGGFGGFGGGSFGGGGGGGKW